jgi:NAD-dependent DNA ligase
VVLSRVRAVLEDGVITETERAHLVDTLTKLVGGGLDQSASATMGVTELLEFDQVATIEFSGAAFCLTGDFVYAPREVCERAILSRGGLVKAGVSKALRYLVVGGLGSAAWKHGSFGTKIDKAMQLKREGAALLVVDEPHWTAAIERCPVKPLQSNP